MKLNMKKFARPQAKAAISNMTIKRRANNYWEDPVYQFVSRGHRMAQESGNATEMNRMSTLMQQIVSGQLSEHAYSELEALRMVAEKQAKTERKKQAKQDPSMRQQPAKQTVPGVNIVELKKRLFNPQTSPENMIKSLELMPKEIRKETAASFTPYLRSKIATYLKQRGL